MKYQPNMHDHWKLRLVDATRGNASMTGAIVLAILNHVPNKRPFIKGLGRIDKDGIVWARFYPRKRLSTLVPLGFVQEWLDELRRLADIVQMNDGEAEEFFGEARKWIERDERAVSRLD